jgi:hypothetical protein
MKYIRIPVIIILMLTLLLSVSTVLAYDPDEHDDGSEHEFSVLDDGARYDPSAALSAHDAAMANVISSGPYASVTKNLGSSSAGERNFASATTDVWAHNGYAYTGTFNNPCGGDPEAGVWIWDVHNKNKASFVGVIPSPTGSRSNDVKVAAMNSGDILVHSNEACASGGPGGFEIWDVDDPTNPKFLAHVQVDEIAEITPFFFAPGSLEDNGVHNLWLFSQGDKDYAAAQSGGVFDGFQIFDITDPTSPSLVSGWGAEEVFDPGVGDLTLADDPTGARTLNSILWLLGFPPFDGFGASPNRLLHDFTITADGSKAYLAHWDAGLILLDISDPANPEYISTALDPVNGSLDGEVNSHSVWPSEDGTIVVEGEEDFSVFESEVPPTNLSLEYLNTIPGVGASTSTGDVFEANQTGNFGTLTDTSLTVTSGSISGQTFDVAEMVGNNVPLGGGSVSGNLVWVGRACPGDPLENPLTPGDIAIVRRGTCFFSDKEASVAAAGAGAVVIANNQQNSAWSGLRIWDYSDPANPVLASTFDTVCSANPSDSSCDRAGTYSSHNVLVETRGNQVKAYISWYTDGMLVLDVSDPYNPVEIGRYTEPGEVYWGIYKETNSPWIYGSDRNGGLRIFKEFGSGSGD